MTGLPAEGSRRATGPTLVSAAERARLREPEAERDLFHRDAAREQLVGALAAHLVEHRAQRGALLREVAPQRPPARAELLRHRVEGRIAGQRCERGTSYTIEKRAAQDRAGGQPRR